MFRDREVDYISPLDALGFLGVHGIEVKDDKKIIEMGKGYLYRSDLVEMFYLMFDFPEAGFISMECDFIDDNGDHVSGCWDPRIEMWRQGEATLALVCKNYRGDESYAKTLYLSFDNFKEKLEAFIKIPEFEDFLEETHYYNACGEIEAFFCFLITGELLEEPEIFKEISGDMEWLYDN